MRQFDFYEFVGVIVPGTAVLIGTALCIPAVKEFVFANDLSIGEAALSLIVAYGLGQLTAAVGNLIETLWWKAWGGMPTDWPRSGAHRLLAAAQVSRIQAAVAALLGHDGVPAEGRVPADEWHGIVRQIYARLLGAGKAARVDIFNGNYGLNRGLAAALLTILILVLTTKGWLAWPALLLVLLGVCAALYRMHRFARHYARELYVQFLTLDNEAVSTSSNTGG